MSGEVRVITGILNPGEASGIPVIRQAQQEAAGDKTVIFDCPPGSACAVQESIRQADYCILAAEPTAFGFHNLQMVEELVRLHKKPCGIIIDKMEGPYEPLDSFCREKNLPVLLRIPYKNELASLISQGRLAAAWDADFKLELQKVYQLIGGSCL